MKSADFADFNADFVDFNGDFVDFNVDFVDFTDFGLKPVKLTVIFHSTVRTQGETSIFFWKSVKSTESIKSTKSALKSADFAEIHGFLHFSLNLQEDNIYVKWNTIFALYLSFVLIWRHSFQGTILLVLIPWYL